MIEIIPFEKVPYILGLNKLSENIHISEHLATPEEDLVILYKLIKTTNPKYILEIGTFYGHTSLGFAINSPTSKIYTIDICKEMKLDVPSYQEIEILFKKDVGIKFRNKGYDIIQLFGDSRGKIVYESLPIFDFIYIDGNHSYNAIISDTMNVLTKTTKGSIIFWHDYKDDGFVQTKEALEEISILQNKCIYHINSSWLAFMIV